LAIRQIAEGWVTGHTPPVATIPNDTICDNNITCKGKYPELYAFAKNIYKEETQQFDYDMVLKWLNYNDSIV